MATSSIVCNKGKREESGSFRSLSSAGYCFIICNTPPALSKRYLPVKRLGHILKVRYRLSVLNFSRLSNTAIDFLLQNISQVDQSSSSCLVVIIIDSNVNSTKKETISSKEVIDYFSEERCPSLKDKPKVFLFQNVSDSSDECLEDERIKLSCIHPEASASYSDLSSILDTLQSYTQSCTTGSIFVNSSQTSDVTNSQLSKSFLVLTDHLIKIDNIKQSLITELSMKLKLLIPLREMTLKLLAENESLIIKTCDDVHTCRIVGGAGSATGTIFAVTGLALIPVTLGISLALTGIGAGIGAAGGITAFTSSLAGSIEKNSLRDLQSLMSLDLQLCRSVEVVCKSLGSLGREEEKEGLKESDFLDGFLEKSRKFLESMELVELVSKAYSHLNNKKFSAIAWLKEYVAQRQQELERVKQFMETS